MKIGLVQLNSQDNIAENLDQASSWIVQAAQQGADLIALPEVMHLRVGPVLAERYLQTAEPIPGPITQRFGQLARQLSVHLLLGSIGETSGDARKIYNTSVLLGPQGQMIARYRKVHLFDVRVDAQTGDRESDRYLPGDELVTADTSFGKLGLSICYDLRFPELYRAMAIQGARVVFVPANFTHATGTAHWMTLLRARAIENNLFIVAPAQCGDFPQGFQAFGHSVVIDPWGKVLCEMDDKPGATVVEIDLSQVSRVRAMLPALEQRRPDVYAKWISTGV